MFREISRWWRHNPEIAVPALAGIVVAGLALGFLLLILGDPTGLH